MKIIDVRWTPRVNMLVIRCSCKTEFEHRADRWRVTCPNCATRENLRVLRDRIQPGDLR